MATLGEMTTRLARKLQDQNNTAVSLVALREAVNFAVRTLKLKRWWFNEFEEAVTLTAEDPVLTLVATTPLIIFEDGGIQIVDGTMFFPAHKVSSAIYDLCNTQALGRPTKWVYRNGGYELYPYPDTAYSVIVRGLKDYTAFATDGTDDGDTNDFLTLAEDVVENAALARLHGTERHDKEAADTFERYAEQDYANLMAVQGQKVGTGGNLPCSFLL